MIRLYVVKDVYMSLTRKIRDISSGKAKIETLYYG